MVWSVAIKIKQLLHSQAETDLGQNSTETTVTILDASTQACSCASNVPKNMFANTLVKSSKRNDMNMVGNNDNLHVVNTTWINPENRVFMSLTHGDNIYLINREGQKALYRTIVQTEDEGFQKVYILKGI